MEQGSPVNNRLGNRRGISGAFSLAFRLNAPVIAPLFLLILVLFIQLVLPAAVHAQGELPRIEAVSTPAARQCQWQIRSFAETVRRSLHQNIGIPVPDRTKLDPLRLELGFGPKKGPYVGRSVLSRKASGKICGVVRIHNPFEAHPDDMRFAIAEAVIKAEICSRAGKGTPPTDPPDWFIRGIAAQTDRELRVRNYEETYSFWAHGSLPRIDALLGDDSGTTQKGAVSAQITAWVIERTARNGRWDRLFDYLAAGKPWTAEAFLYCLFGDVGAGGHDAAFDSWMASRGSHIYMAGTTTSGTFSRFRIGLAVFPWDYAGHMNPLLARAPFISLRDLFSDDPSEADRSVMRRKAARIRSAAPGRDPEFQRLCAIYSAALDSGSAGEADGAIRQWEEAEELRMKLEARTAMGEILGRQEAGRE